jgi:hypothetical protein
MRLMPLLLLCPPLLLAAGEIQIDLRNPVYKNGILYTNQGGVIQNEEIRIQARTIQYIHKGGVQKIEADGDLLIQYKGRVYVGSELEYDLKTKTGTVYDAKTYAMMWYVGGDSIQLLSDGGYRVSNAFITTCENRDSSWDLHASRVNVRSEDLLAAKKVRFRLFKIPMLWLPSFKINLKRFKEPILRYSINWDKGAGPRAMIRYQLYSWRDFALYGRVEYRWSVGWGGALETEYFPRDQKTTFVTRNYLAKDVLENAPNPRRRYRVQGALRSETDNRKTTLCLTWDKYSDVRMPNDFKSEDFEVNPGKKTVFFIRHQEDELIASIKARPRLNTFESIKQDFPTFYLTFRPAPIGPTGIVSSTVGKVSFLDFAYSDDLTASIAGYQSARLEARQTFYRPFSIGALTLTPQIGLVGLYYNQSPQGPGTGLATLLYGGRIQAEGKRRFASRLHILQPYLDYIGYTRPHTPADDHYIFTIQDGYAKLNQIQLGLRQLLHSAPRPASPGHASTEDAPPTTSPQPYFTADLYANAFFSDLTIPRLIPKLYLNLHWQLPALHLSFKQAWDFWHQTLDHCNALAKWTVNENIAFTLEGRYRSKYDWRKADHDNFFLDVYRPEPELLDSPLSDRRITLLANCFIRFSPLWEAHLQSHHGFFRKNQTPYNELKIDLFAWISSSWKVRLSYSHTLKDDRFTAGLSMVKK